MRRYGTFFPPAFPRSHVKKRMIRSTNPSARFVVLTGSAIGLNYRILRNCRVFDSQLAELQRILLETEIPGIDVLNREHWRTLISLNHVVASGMHAGRRLLHSFQSHPVIYGMLQFLFAAQVSLSCLHGRMTEEKLDLL